MKRTLLIIFTLLLSLSATAHTRQHTQNERTDNISSSAERLKAGLSCPLTEREAEMLSGTERVIVIDSIIVHKDDLLKAYTLSESVGHLGWDETKESTYFTVGYGDERYQSVPVDSIGQHITKSYCFNGEWTEAEEIFTQTDSLESEEVRKEFFPFLMSDGVTLYFAAEQEDGLGGLDIYITRQGGEDHEFYRPENMGMPFNSTANDYLLVIDEEAGIGCFATDRNMHEDSVCIYYFLPSEQRETYEDSLQTQEQLTKLARLESIRETWLIDPQKAEEGKKRLEQHREAIRAQEESRKHSSSTAQAEAERSLIELEDTLLRMRKQWHSGEHSEELKEMILELEELLPKKRKEVKSILYTE